MGTKRSRVVHRQVGLRRKGLWACTPERSEVRENQDAKITLAGMLPARRLVTGLEAVSWKGGVCSPANPLPRFFKELCYVSFNDF